MRGHGIVTHQHRLRTLHPAIYFGPGACAGGQLLQCQAQTIRLQLHGEKSARQGAGFRYRVVQHPAHFFGGGGFGQLTGGELLFEGMVVETKTDQLLAKPVMQVLADPGLFAVADLQNFALQPTPVRDIFRNANDTDDFAGAVTNRERTVAYPSQRAIGPDDAVFLVVFPGGLFREHGLGNRFAIFRMDGLQPRVRRLIKRLATAPPDYFVRRADIDHAGFRRVSHPESVGDVFCQLPQLLHGLAQLFLGLLAIADFTFQRGSPIRDPLLQMFGQAVDSGYQQNDEY